MVGQQVLGWRVEYREKGNPWVGKLEYEEPENEERKMKPGSAMWVLEERMQNQRKT